MCYVELARELGRDQPLYAIQSPGLNGSDELCNRLEEMAARYIELIRERQPHGPYFLGGWSMGGVIAYEAAQQLIAQGDEVALVALIDSWLPRLEHLSDDPQQDNWMFLGELIWYLFGRPVPLNQEALNDLQPDERLTYIWEQARLANIIPPDVTISTLSRLAEVFQNNARALKGYVAKSYPGSVVLFRATQHDPDIARHMSADWEDLVQGTLTTYSVPGDHFSLLVSPQVQLLSRRLSACLHLASPASLE
jgi:thioesterase domain-containing protein